MSTKHKIPNFPFIKFFRGKILYNGIIIDVCRKGYKVKYMKKYPNCSSFYTAQDICIVPINKALPYK